MLALALAGVFAGSASAAVTGLERIAVASPLNSAGKSVTAACPAGKQVVGAGGDILGGIGQVRLGFVKPNGALTSVTAQGREDENGYAGNWTVSAHAVCATPPPGLGLVTATSPNNSANKSVTATCPAGKRLLGTGAEVGGGAQVAPNDVSPDANLKAVTVQGLEDENGTNLSWQARAFAICANPVAGLVRVLGDSPTDSAASKTATAICSPGKEVLGAGAALGSSGEVVLDRLEPSSDLLGVLIRGQEDEDGTAASWFARSFAICAAASERITETSFDAGLSSQSANPDCPAGKQVTGGGGEITGGAGQVGLTILGPFDATGFSANAFEDVTGFAGNWFLRGYAVCATPLPGLAVVSNSSSTDSATNKSASVACPAGKRVVGAGGAIGGDGVFGQVRLDGVFPLGTPASSVGATAFEPEFGFAGNWSVTARAVCALPPPGLEVVTAISDVASDPASVAATCPPGKNLIGTGANLEGAVGQVVLDDVRPDEALTHVTVTGLEDESGVAEDWGVIAHAICANP